MQYKYIIYEEELDLINMDSANQNHEVNISVELAGVVVEELILIENLNVIDSDEAGTIEAWAMNVAFVDSDLDTDIDFGVPDVMAVLANAADYAGEAVDVRYLPDPVDMVTMVLNTPDNSYHLVHKKVKRVYGENDFINLRLHAYGLDSDLATAAFGASNDSVRFYYVAKYGVFC